MADQPTLAETKPTTATFSVKTSDGAFDSSLSVVVGRDPKTYQPVIEAWLRLMHTALVATSDPEDRHAD